MRQLGKFGAGTFLLVAPALPRSNQRPGYYCLVAQCCVSKVLGVSAACVTKSKWLHQVLIHIIRATFAALAESPESQIVINSDGGFPTCLHVPGVAAKWRRCQAAVRSNS